MDPKELRVGNILEIAGTYFTVLGIMIDGTLAMDEIRDRPLTARQGRPIWMDKTKDPKPQPVLITLDIHRKLDSSQLLKVANLLIMGQMEQKAYVKGYIPAYDVRVRATGFRINYLHQLQNIFFDATGEELVVNL